LANDRPFFARTTLANIEIFAVLGIFTLYALEFAGIHTFSQLLPMKGQTTAPALSFFTSGGTPVVINMGTIAIMAIVPMIVIIYFAFLKKRIKVRK